MTFTKEVKNELTKIDFNDSQLKSLLSAFLKNNVVINLSKEKMVWEIKLRNSSTIRFILNCLVHLYNINKKISYKKEKSISYKLEIIGGDLDKIEQDLCLFSDPMPLLDSIENKCAFFVGCFLSGGSINSPLNSNYHFEIKSHDIDLIKIIEKIMIEFNTHPKIFSRKNSYIIYIKKSEHISDLLKLMGANNSMFEYEQKRICRDYSNQFQRLNNLDVSNLKKSVLAGNDQIKWINFIKSDKLLYDLLSEKQKIFCEIRLNNPQFSLNEIMNEFYTKYNINITRTGLNHYVIKIKSLYFNNIK